MQNPNTFEGEKTPTPTSENSLKQEHKKFEFFQKKFKSRCQNFKNWNETEDNLLRRLYRLYGNKWKIIGKYFSNRSPYQLCYRIKKLEENSKENFFIGKRDNLQSEILENSFFDNLENLQKALKPIQRNRFRSNTKDNANTDLELNEDLNIDFEKN
jgi:hypothetical protein